MAPSYPTREDIKSLFANLSNGNAEAFYSRVSPDVEWDVLGHHPLAGHFTTLEDWKRGALGPINAVLREPLQLQVRNIVGGGTEEWAVVELFANGICKNGGPDTTTLYRAYADAFSQGMEYPQQYSWVMRFDNKGTIVQVRAYLDSALVQKAIDQNS
ncbi:hypothetical protein MBLNU459_g1437t2 [Dothideomycetes sp. NU459]